MSGVSICNRIVSKRALTENHIIDCSHLQCIRKANRRKHCCSVLAIFRFRELGQNLLLCCHNASSPTSSFYGLDYNGCPILNATVTTSTRQRQKLPRGAIRLPARESTTSASILSASAKPKYCAQLGRPRRAPGPETACAGWHPHRRMQSARVASRPLQASLGKVVRFPSSSRYRVARCRFRQTAAIATPRATVAQQDPQAIDRISSSEWRGLGTVPDRKARFRKQRQGQRASPSCHSRWRLVPNEAGPVRKEINAVSGLLEGSTSTGQEGRVENRAVCPNLLLSFPKGRTSA